MKYPALAFCFLLLCITKTRAQADSPVTTADSTMTPATVYIIRATGLPQNLVNFRVLVDDVMHCKVANNRYAVLKVKPGKHTFYITTWDLPGKREKLGLEISIEGGKTYYLRMVNKQRFFEGQLYFEEITRNSAIPLLEQYKEDTNCDK
jgi:hypothetical protein